MQQYKKLILAFSGLSIIVINAILKHFPEFVEQYYSNGLYVWISKLMRYSFGWLPFSVGDILYTVAILYVLRWLIQHRKRIINDTKNWFLELCTGLSFAYIAFHVLWAFNYYRQPLHVALDLNDDYTTEELNNVIDYLITEANEAHSKLNPIDSLKIEFPYSKAEIIDKIPQGYVELQKTFPELKYNPASIKSSIYSTPLTYMGFSGYLNPFTNEAQVDVLIPKYKLATTGSHEVAHQLGFAAENEANFIGGLAAMHNPDPYMEYSGKAFALRHCLYELYRRDPEAYEQKKTLLYKGVLKNYQEVQDFWMAYQNPLEPIFASTYDTFLKANNQAKGMESYSYVVALFVNYFEGQLEK
ncbi:DUF3810 domain-containing protein [Winogradskyella sp. A3E31]|uniref:DUF3810 domain-containing protein n=1 Tax=Winogradskyella sp. A3E31 TaxID=3349637 RepID=UPI00398B5EC8